MYRKTYVKVNLSHIKYNVQLLINKYSSYQYYFGVVKADCYGHHDLEVVKTILDAGCNYLAVATLEEALKIRKEIKNIPILCLGVIDVAYLSLCLKNKITITISNTEYLKKVKKDYPGLKAHIKINTGMNRLGVREKEELNQIQNMMRQKHLVLEGIYTHIYDAHNKKRTMKQYAQFEKITKDMDLKEIPIVHVSASEATEFYPKRFYANGCRLGIAMYGLVDYKQVSFKSTFSLYSEVIQINEVVNETVGYNGTYRAKGKERIAIVPIGYADGILRKNTGRDVYINQRKYKIVGNICMDMLFVKVDDSVQIGDQVIVIKDIDHIKEIANHLDTISYEVICSIGKRVPRIYVK